MIPEAKLQDKKKTLDTRERAFSLELKSKSAVKTASLDGNEVLLEGTLGKLEKAGFLEGSVLELVGTDGVLRVDLRREELLLLPPSPNPSGTPTKELEVTIDPQ